MDAQMRESFLRELMILQSPPILSPDSTSSSTTSYSFKQNITDKDINCASNKIETISIQEEKKRIDNRQVNITLLDGPSSTGRTLSGLFVACDTNLTHILINDLKTPIGTQSSALLRLNDVIAITGLAMTEQTFLPKKALVLRKFSRLEYERSCHPNLNEEQLAINLGQRGSAYESLKHYDQVQKSCLQQIESALAANNIEFMTVDRYGYSEEKIDWADVIITSGGDGTFLMAASKVTTRDKPVIGINSDPTKSVGHLCLPSKYSNNFDQVIELLKGGKYQWQYKQRLRVTLIGEAADEDPKELNDIRSDLRGMNRCLDEDSQEQAVPVRNKVVVKTRQLKERALNEVFLGETISARVSYYELSVDNNGLTKMKSSGLTVCTGTGSTSWYYNINKLTEEQVQSIVSIINKVTKSSRVPNDNAAKIGDITKQFNKSLTFSPTEPIMAYSIRDPIDSTSNTGHCHRGYAKRIEVKSRMQNACLVLDGCQFYPFNDGSYAQIEVHDEDALKTISVESS